MSNVCMDCLFCKIVSGAIPAKRLYEDDTVLAFPDINPQAPTHILVIPKRHIASCAQLALTDKDMLGQLMLAVSELAKQNHLDNGYRLVINTGPDGGQTVDHMHIHLLGGRPMHWPPG